MGESDRSYSSQPRARLAAFALTVRITVPIVLVAVLLYRVDWSTAAQEISQIALWALVALFAAMVLELVVSVLKWSYALRMHDLRFPFPFLLQTLLSGFFFNSFLPTAVGGDVYRVYRTLPPDGFRFRALSAVLIERAVGLLTLLALGGIGALLIADEFQVARVYWLLMLGAAAAGTVGIVALERGWLRSFADRWHHFAPWNAIRRSIDLLRNRRREWVGLVAGSVLFQSMSIGILFCLFALVSGGATLAQTALIAAVVGVAAVLPISINGIGVMEGALVGTALMLGIDYDTAVVVAFLRRFLNLALGVSCGVAHVATLGRDRRASGEKGFGTVLAKASQQALAHFRLRTERQASNDVSVPPVPDVPLAAAPTTKGGDDDWLHAGLLEFTHDAIIIWEMSGGGIQYFNQAAERLYGYDREEARGKTTHELLKTRLAGGVDSLEKDLARFGIWVGELVHTARDGRQIQVEGRLALMSQHNGRWLVLEVNRDVSDRKAAEAARRRMQRQLGELHNGRDRKGRK